MENSVKKKSIVFNSSSCATAIKNMQIKNVNTYTKYSESFHSVARSLVEIEC